MQKHVYSANIIRFNLLLRYISNQMCKVLQEDFPLPSKSLLRKLKYTQLLHEKNGSASKDIVLMLDEMYLQKCLGYAE